MLHHVFGEVDVQKPDKDFAYQIQGFLDSIRVVVLENQEADADIAAPVGVADQDPFGIHPPVLRLAARTAALDEGFELGVQFRSRKNAGQQLLE